MVLVMRKIMFILILIMVTITTVLSFVFADLTIEAGETFTLSTDETMIIDGNLIIEATGILDASASGANIIISGDWLNSGTFISGNNTVTFTDNTLVSNITGNTNFYNFSCTTANKQFAFQAGSIQTVSNILTLNGQATGTEIMLRSLILGTRWTFDVPGNDQNIECVDVQDSESAGNNIYAGNSINSGNNDDSQGSPHWVFTAPISITSPGDGYTIGQIPTIIGCTLNPNTSFTIQGISGGATIVVTQGISDDNGNFRVVVASTTSLDLGANILTPYIGVTTGLPVNVTVVSNPTTQQVCTINVPTLDPPSPNTRVKSNPFIVSGFGPPGAEIRIEALDSDGNLVLDCGSANSDSITGEYTINCDAVLSNLIAGINILSVTAYTGTGNAITTSVLKEVTFYDPFGIVFDSVNDNPIEGATVTLYYDNDSGPGRDWILAQPGVHIVAEDVNPQTTAADGFYSFICTNGDFYTDINVAGYIYPSAETSFPPERTIVTGSKGEVFTVNGAVIEMDQPMSPTVNLLRIEKEANKKEVTVGDVVTYTITIENISSGTISNVYLEDKIPAGFKYIKGKVRLDNALISEPTGGRPLTFNIGTLSQGQSRTLKYQLVVGSGVTPGDYKNKAFAKYFNGTVISNEAVRTVEVVSEPLFDLGTVIGKVFWDWNENGIQDNVKTLKTTKPETGINNVEIITEEGTVITTDKDGKYHLPAMTLGRHLLRIDERTLPDGAYLTTQKAVILDITPGLLTKVNFGISLPEGKEFIVTPFQIVQERDIVHPRLNIFMLSDGFSKEEGSLKGRAEFRIFTNYYLFINKWRLEIVDKYTRRVVKTFKGTQKDIFKPIYWFGDDDQKIINKLVSGEYVYRLVVRDAKGREDVTIQRDFKYVKKELLSELIDKESKVNNLKEQNIKIEGETIRIKSQDYSLYMNMSLPEKIDNMVVIKTKEKVIEISIVKDEKLVVDDLLQGRSIKESKKQNEIEMILPKGKYIIKFNYEQEEGMNKNIKQENLVTQNTGLFVKKYTKEITVGDDYLFLVAMGDGKLGYNFNSGNIEPVEHDDKFKEGTWVEGKLAYYLKGKIKGKYLITSSFDSDRQRKELFRNLDPDKYYPVYGDTSSIDYKAANTQGMLYVLIECNKSQILWGNYDTAFTDTEFARFMRTLYGGKIHLETASITNFGDPYIKLVVFGAYAEQKAAHNEFIGTGGSLYYVKHKDVVEGSEKIKIEVREKNNGLVLSTKEMKENIDYEIDYSNGRITFYQSISRFSESNLIISNQLEDGNPIYIIVDYEYEVKDSYDEGVIGIRMSESFTDYLLVGGTYIKEGETEQDYELKGIDVSVNLPKNIKLTAEYAESKSEATGSFISNDGGISFEELSLNEDAEDKAYGLKGRASLFSNKLGLGSYYKWIGNDFSTSATNSQQGKELMGFNVTYDINSRMKMVGLYDIQELIEDATLETELQLGTTRTETTSIQFVQSADRLKLTSEYRHQEVTERREEFESQMNRKGDTLAIKGDYKLSERIEISLEQQATITGDKNNQTTAGVGAKMVDWLSLRAKETVSNQGTATSVGMTSTFGNKLEISNDYSRANYNSGEISDITSLSASSKLDEKTAINSTYALTDSMNENKTSSVNFGINRKINNNLSVNAGRNLITSKNGKTFSNIFGLSGNINDKWGMQGTFEKGVVQDYDGSQYKRKAGTMGLSYVNRDVQAQEIIFKASSKSELRLDEGEEDKKQILLYNAVEGKLDSNTTVFAKANMSETKNITTGLIEAQFKELGFGLAYRPVGIDWLNLLAKYTYLEDDSPVVQSDNNDIEEEKAHIISGETIIDVTAKWQLVEKVAYKIGEEKVTGFDFTKTSTWLWINRLNYNINKDWQVSGEYRILTQDQAEDQKCGFLFELSRNMGRYVQMGIGYNFTKFNDDLTHLNYMVQGPFIRLTAKFYDHKPSGK